METERRSFLKKMMMAPFIFLPDKRLRPEPPASEYLLNRFSVAGFQYYEAPKLIGDIRVGDPLVLCAEPENPYDVFAVKILYGARQIGYVPRSDNKAISRLLQQGAPLRCEVVEASPDRAPWQALKVKVSMINRRGSA